jgi:hypothetical protein
LAAVNREFFGNTMDRMIAGGALFDGNAIPGIRVVFETREGFTSRKSVQAIGAVNAIGTPENEGNLAAASILKNVNGSEAVVGEIEERIRIASNDRRLGALVSQIRSMPAGRFSRSSGLRTSP